MQQVKAEWNKRNKLGKQVIKGLTCVVCMLFVVFSSMVAKVEAAQTVQTTQASAQTMTLHAIYIGANHGDAVLLESNGEYLLMDMGTNKSYDNVSNYLKSIGVTKLSLYYSHLHSDHTGGLLDGEGKGYVKLLENFQVTHIYLPPQELYTGTRYSGAFEIISNKYEKYSKWWNSNANASTDITYLPVGSSFTIGAARVDIIGPVNTASFDRSVEDEYINNCSLAAKITCGATTYLTAGDTRDEGEAALIAAYGTSLKADIYKMSHHGLAPANSATFLSYVQPTYTFGMNTGFTENVEYNGSIHSYHRRTFTSRENCSAYGFVYMVGDEQRSLAIQVSTNTVTLYQAGNSTPLNAGGWVKVYGSDGINCLYDYYYFNTNGKPLTGVQVIDGKTYNLGTGGCRETGNYIITNGAIAYQGWRKNDAGTVYRYYAKKTDELSVGLCRIKSCYYIFDANGWQKTGWVSYNGSKYYMDPDTGHNIAAGWQTVDGIRLFFAKKGRLVVNKWLSDGSEKCYVNGSGLIVKGWMNYAGNRYYLDSDTGYRATGITQIRQKVYAFDSHGRLRTNTQIKVDKKVYTVRSDGVIKGSPSLTTIKVKSTKVSATRKITVKWRRNKQADGYKVYYSTERNGHYKLAGTVSNNKTTTFKTRKMKQNTTYYVKVVAYKKFGGVKIYAKDSTIQKVNIR